MYKESATLLIPEKAAIDASLQAIIQEVQGKDQPLYEALLPEREVLESARTSFYQSHGEEIPDLRPRHVSEAKLKHREVKLHEVKQRVLEADAQPEVIQAYRWWTNEQLAQVGMLRASVGGESRRFDWYNRFIYGMPRNELFAATASEFRSLAEELGPHASSPVHEAAEAVLRTIPDYQGNRALLQPDEAIFTKVRRNHYAKDGYFTLLLAGIEVPEEGHITPEVGDPIIRQVLRNIDSQAEIVDADGTSWSCDQGLVKRPVNYRMSLKRFMGLPVGHEVGSHELERQNGKRQPLRLLASGLDRYENGNEGRAVIREQVPYASFSEFAKTLRWHDIMRRYFAGSLAVGLNGERHDFTQAYRVMNAVDTLRERLKNPDDIPTADAKAHKRTWDLLATRIMRGTDGHGGAFLKDIVYLQGNLACWENFGRIAAGDLGKFDITNARHSTLLQSLGILAQEEVQL